MTSYRMRIVLLIAVSITIIIFSLSCKSVNSESSKVAAAIDSLMNQSGKPFNGIILIAKEDKPVFFRMYGFSDLDNKVPFKKEDQFVIGSVSKQFTAAIVMQLYEKGLIDLHIPIRAYLPDLPMAWADTVTTHHLLSHTHGIIALDQPVKFSAGSQYDYSQIGYDLLAKISEKVSGKSFNELSAELFRSCGMNNTFHPDRKEYRNLVKGYDENENKVLIYSDESLKQYPAAGAFISSAFDLLLWNQYFFGDRLLKPETLALITEKKEKAVRDHPIFGYTEYGYGITVANGNNIIQWGQTGYAPGFVSMNFYFPQTKTSAIVLENVCYSTDDIKETFFYHNAILDIIKEQQKNGNEF